MRLALTAAMLIPIGAMVMGIRTGKFCWNILLTLSCAAIVLLTGRGKPMIPLALALAVSLAGDWFMAHKGGKQIRYVLGITLFLLGHAGFLWYAIPRFAGDARIWVSGLALAGMIGFYFVKRIFPNLNTLMRVAVGAYALISIASLVAAAGMRCPSMYEQILYAFGILMIVASDVMIAECDFAHDRTWSSFIMPLYYLCHILVAASSIAGIGVA